MKVSPVSIRFCFKLYWLIMAIFLIDPYQGLYAQAAKKKVIPYDRVSEPMIIDHLMSFDVNRIFSYVTNQGHFVKGKGIWDNGLFWPSVPRTSREQSEETLKSDKAAGYAGGLWIAGKVNGEIRTACAGYLSEYIAGKILPTGERDNATEEKYRVYKIMKGDGPGVKDWDEWPVEDGAPVNEDGTPKLIGDQTLWFVMNDLEISRHNQYEHMNALTFKTPPIGLEVQTTVFGFNESSPLGDIMFVEWRIINKGSSDLDSAFVAVWEDVDLGWYDDDMVGCDIPLGMAYYYNGTYNDLMYGSETPAVGFDFFRGPEVPYGSGHYLQMTSFIKYWGGAPAGHWDPKTAEEVYYYLNGYWGNGDPIIDSETGEETKFIHAGDPVTGTGDLDYVPGDRRSLMSSGPFTLAVGDTQVIVGAKIIAPGLDPPSAVNALRFFDKFAQGAYDNDFEIMRSPPIEELAIRRLDQEILLSWYEEADSIETFNNLGYTFQGYIVYQGESATGPWRQIAIYDLNDGIQIILDEQFDSATGQIISSPAVQGKDSGLQRYIRITEDAIFNPNQRLSNYRDYYFAVTTYSVNLDAVPRVIESAIVGKTVAPTSTDFGVEILQEYGDVDTLDHYSGTADGSFFTNIVDPTLVPDASYKITFTEDHSISVDKNGNILRTIPESDQSGVSNYTALDNAPIVDGIQFHLVGSFDTPITFYDDEFTTDADPSDGDLILAGDLMIFGLPTGLYSILGNGVPIPESDVLKRDLQLRFTGITVNGDDDNDTPIAQGGQWTTQWECAAEGQADLDTIEHTQMRAPFELWDIENSRQVNFAVMNMNFDGMAPYGKGIGDPNITGMEPRWRISGLDYIIPIMTEYETESAETTVHSPNDSNATWTLLFAPRGYAVWSYGDVYTISYYNPLVPGEDEFLLNTYQGMITGQEALKKTQIQKINVVPNPYWAHNPGERNMYNRFIRLTNLPGSGVTIRIFTLAGDLVRVIDDAQRARDGTSGLQYANWDLKNDAGIPVASGVYLIHFEVEGVGNVVRKAAIILQEERLIY